jgi:hypothetical protein
MMKTNSSLLVLFCREDSERHQRRRAGEDVCSAVQFYFLQDSAQKDLQLFTSNSFETTWCIPFLKALPTYSTNPLFQLSNNILSPFISAFILFSSKLHTSYTSMLLVTHVLGWSITCTYKVQHDECENKEGIWSECWYLLSMKREELAYCCCNVLGRTEVPPVHYLVENKIWWGPTHVLSSVKPPISALVFSLTCEKNKTKSELYFAQKLTALPPKLYLLHTMSSYQAHVT